MLLNKIQRALGDRTLSVVAVRTGLSARTISNVMHGVGTPNPATLKVLADYLGVRDDE
jgi:transcriptional regulator with XRE-family HTH domain